MTPNETVDVINRLYEYKLCEEYAAKLKELKIQTKYFKAVQKKIDKDQHLRDLESVKKIDINKLHDRTFWGLNISDSLSAVAANPYYKLKYILNH